MRHFNEVEKDIISQLVKSRKGCEIVDLRLYTILESHLESFAVDWNTDESQPSITVSCQPGIGGDVVFFKLCDIISLLCYLEKEGLLLIHSYKETNQEQALYNHERYERTPEGKYISTAKQSIEVFGTTYTNNGHFISHSTTTRSSLAITLDRLANSLFHPTAELVELVDCDFISRQEKEYNMQLSESKKQTRYALFALICAIISIIIASATLFISIRSGKTQQVGECVTTGMCNNPNMMVE